MAKPDALTTALLRCSSTTQDLYVVAKMTGRADLAKVALEHQEVLNKAIREAMTPSAVEEVAS